MNQSDSVWAPLVSASPTRRSLAADLRRPTWLSGSWVGNVYQSVGAFGRQNCGDYFTLNLAARYFVEADRHHRVMLAERVRRGIRDSPELRAT